MSIWGGGGHVRREGGSFRLSAAGILGKVEAGLLLAPAHELAPERHRQQHLCYKQLPIT